MKHPPINLNFTGARPIIMGILNVTPDSFSDGGRYNSVDAALNHCEEMIAQGADIVDIGAESTRPGHQQISTDEELARLLPVLEAVRARFDVPISVDTYRAKVARAALDAGADIINDIWGLSYDPKMAQVAAEADCPVVLMHNRNHSNYSDFLHDWLTDMQNMVNYALTAGIKKEHLILDPGIGFAKGFSEDACALNHLSDLSLLGYPVLLGVSRKRIVGALSGQPKETRDEATAAINLRAYRAGTRIFRVHNVRINRIMLDTISNLEDPCHGHCEPY